VLFIQQKIITNPSLAQPAMVSRVVPTVGHVQGHAESSRRDDGRGPRPVAAQQRLGGVMVSPQWSSKERIRRSTCLGTWVVVVGARTTVVGVGNTMTCTKKQNKARGGGSQGKTRNQGRYGVSIKHEKLQVGQKFSNFLFLRRCFTKLLEGHFISFAKKTLIESSFGI